MHSDKFVAISIKDIKPDEKLPFDIYLFLQRNDKYILYRKKNSTIDAKKIEQFEHLNMKDIYICEDDRQLYNEFTTNEFVDIIENNRFDPVKKRKELKRLSVKFLQDIFTERSTERKTLEQNLTQVVKSIVTSVDKSHNIKVIYDKITELRAADNTEANHCINVSTYSVMFAFLLGIVLPNDIKDLTEASIFHDVGLKKLPKKLTEKYRAGEALNTAEVLKIRKHSVMCEDALIDLDVRVKTRSLNIIKQHHEQPDGLGYPLGISGDALLELSKILSIANIFDNVSRINRSVDELITPPEIFQKMKNLWCDENQIFDINTFNEISRSLGLLLD